MWRTQETQFTHSQVPENEFYVDFGFKMNYPTKEAWQSLNEIARVTSENVIYEWARLSDKGVKIEMHKDDSHPVYFTLHGRNVDPNDLVVAMSELQPENFNTLKPKIPHDQLKFPRITIEELNERYRREIC
jgi:hypothetical protein